MHVVVMGCVCQSLIKKLLTYLLTRLICADISTTAVWRWTNDDAEREREREHHSTATDRGHRGNMVSTITARVVGK